VLNSYPSWVPLIYVYAYLDTEQDRWQDKRTTFPKPLEKYDFDFTLNQKVHSIRKRLHHAITILDGTQRTVATLSSLSEAIQELGNISTQSQETFTRELGYMSRSLEAYQSTTKELLSLSSDIKSTVHQ
jgi:hypothetical protein